MKKFHISENGFSVTSDKVSIPECWIYANDFLEAIRILNRFLLTGELSTDIELITPIQRIDFKN